MFSNYNLDDEKQKVIKKLKTCSYNYLEHKIKQEYGGGLILKVVDSAQNNYNNTGNNNMPQTISMNAVGSTPDRFYNISPPAVSSQSLSSNILMNNHQFWYGNNEFGVPLPMQPFDNNAIDGYPCSVNNMSFLNAASHSSGFNSFDNRGSYTQNVFSQQQQQQQKQQCSNSRTVYNNYNSAHNNPEVKKITKDNKFPGNARSFNSISNNSKNKNSLSTNASYNHKIRPPKMCSPTRSNIPSDHHYSGKYNKNISTEQGTHNNFVANSVKNSYVSSSKGNEQVKISLSKNSDESDGKRKEICDQTSYFLKKYSDKDSRKQLSSKYGKNDNSSSSSDNISNKNDHIVCNSNSSNNTNSHSNSDNSSSNNNNNNQLRKHSVDDKERCMENNRVSGRNYNRKPLKQKKRDRYSPEHSSKKYSRESSYDTDRKRKRDEGCGSNFKNTANRHSQKQQRYSYHDYEDEEERKLLNLYNSLKEMDFGGILLPDVDDANNIISDDSAEDSSSNDDRDSNSEANVALSDLEGMLNEDLPERYRNVSHNVKEKLKSKKNEYQKDFVELEKIVLDDLGNTEHFDLLPEGWTKSYHETGIPVYIHRVSRIISLSRPYNLGNADIVRHKIPLSAVPCLQYRKKQAELSTNTTDYARKVGNLTIPIAKVESVEQNRQTLEPEELYQYCSSVMPFRKERIKVNKNIKNAKNAKNLICPSLPPGTKLISFPILEKDGKGNVIRRKEWMINPYGKGYVSLLHEFTQQAIKVQPMYKYVELVKSEQYLAEVYLNSEKFGEGCGGSKKHAKLMAAKDTLEMLIPEIKGKLEEMCDIEKIPTKLKGNTTTKNIFNDIKITDPRILELSARTTEPTPYSMLLTCLRRSFGTCSMLYKYEANNKDNKLGDYSLIVGNKKVIVKCKNKMDGKQKASQAMLQVLHPDLHSYGDLIRLYGSNNLRTPRDKKRMEQTITRLQCLAQLNAPNYAVLSKLHEHLEKKLIEGQKKLPPFCVEDLPKFE